MAAVEADMTTVSSLSHSGNSSAPTEQKQAAGECTTSMVSSNMSSNASATTASPGCSHNGCEYGAVQDDARSTGSGTHLLEQDAAMRDAIAKGLREVLPTVLVETVPSGEAIC